MTVTIPIPLPSAGNLHEHWRNRQRRIKAQRAAVMLAMPRPKLQRERNWLELAGKLVVTMVRISPRKLDSDNLAFAFKGCRDQVAEQLGINDNDPCIAWHYEQETGPQAIRIALACVETHQTHEAPF